MLLVFTFFQDPLQFVLTSCLVGCLKTTWAELFLIRSGTSSPFSPCMFRLFPRLFVTLHSFTNPVFRYLNYNQLSGAIPDSIGNLVNLQRLYVSLTHSSPLDSTSFNSYSNTFSDLCHNWILPFTNLTLSYLRSNQVSGAIPDSIGNLVNLQYLYVSSSFHHSYQQLLFSYSHISSWLSSWFFPSLNSSSAIWILTSWAEPSLILSAILSTFSTCMCHYHFIIRIINSYPHIFSLLSPWQFFPLFIHLSR